MIPHQNDLVTFQHDAKYALNGRMEFKEETIKVLKLNCAISYIIIPVYRHKINKLEIQNEFTKKTHQKQNQRHKLHIIHVSDKTKQIKIKQKTTTTKNGQQKKWHAKPSTIKATSPPHFKKKKSGSKY